MPHAKLCSRSPCMRATRVIRAGLICACVQESDSEDARLERVLRAAAMANDTVILTTLNWAWGERGSVVDVFLESFRLGGGPRELLDPLVIVSPALAAHRRCRQIHAHCLAVATEGVDFSVQKNFMTDGYL